MANNIVIANSQKAKILEGGRTFLNSLDMRLYTSDIALSGTVMPAVGTDEPSDGGYSPVPNPYPNVCVTAGTVGRAVGISPTYTFDHDTGDFNVWGAFFTDPNDADVTVFAASRTSGFAVVAAGQVFVVHALFDLDTKPA